MHLILYIYNMPNEADILLKIRSFFTYEEVPAKTLLVKEGAISRKLYYIDKGSTRVWFNNDGKEVTFQFIFENHFATSVESIITNAPSWYSVETLEPVIADSISVEEFRNKVESFPHVKEFYN